MEYKPVSVRELLTEMKNLSELMVDLAYSAVMFEDRQLAEEVVKLEQRVNEMIYQLLLHAAMAARGRGDAELASGVSQIAMAADRVSNAAADIAKTVLLGIPISPVVRRALRRSEETVAMAKVEEGSRLVGKTLGELSLETSMGVDVIAVRRGGRLFVDPEDDFKLSQGDRVIVRGSYPGVEEFKSLAMGRWEAGRLGEGV